MSGISFRKRSVALVYRQRINDPSFSAYDGIAPPLKIGGTPVPGPGGGGPGLFNWVMAMPGPGTIGCADKFVMG
jgi:hypothetical protein